MYIIVGMYIYIYTVPLYTCLDYRACSLTRLSKQRPKYHLCPSISARPARSPLRSRGPQLRNDTVEVLDFAARRRLLLFKRSALMFSEVRTEIFID